MPGLRSIRRETLTEGWAGWALAISLCAVALACTSDPEWPVITPAALSTPEMAYPDPELGDCFGGVFSRVDAMQCYVLERAQSAGVIDIEKIYEVGLTLRISLNQDGPVDAQVVLFLRERTAEFLDRWPHRVPDTGWCRNPIGPRSGRGCILNSVRQGYLPRTADYYQILFHVGGETARREMPGWAGWRQLWPEGDSGASGAQGDAGPFDVSDVDLTLPEPDCKKTENDAISDYCPDPEFLEYGFAGSGYQARTGIEYYRFKNVPADEAGLQALKDKLIPCNVIGPCVYTERPADGSTRERFTDRDKIVPIRIVPVRYSYLELWRWARILDRFAMSAGNTIGITGASVEDGAGRRSSDRVMLLQDGPAGGRLRETVLVWSYYPGRVADALPTLLPQLGIPVDAVGILKKSLY